MKDARGSRGVPGRLRVKKEKTKETWQMLWIIGYKNNKYARGGRAVMEGASVARRRSVCRRE